MHKDNTDIRDCMRSAGVRQWEVAGQLGVSENTLVRKLRYPLDPEERKRVLEAIREIRNQ